jgi:hypothetical protein
VPTTANDDDDAGCRCVSNDFCVAPQPLHYTLFSTLVCLDLFIKPFTLSSIPHYAPPPPLPLPLSPNFGPIAGALFTSQSPT